MSIEFPEKAMDGDMSCIGFSIINDTTLEGNETFTVTLTTANSIVVLGNTEAVITITDSSG